MFNHPPVITPYVAKDQSTKLELRYNVEGRDVITFLDSKQIHNAIEAGTATVAKPPVLPVKTNPVVNPQLATMYNNIATIFKANGIQLPPLPGVNVASGAPSPVDSGMVLTDSADYNVPPDESVMAQEASLDDVDIFDDDFPGQ
jgi:hypothetical protein